MYGTLFESGDVEMILTRLSKLTPEHQRRWGRLTVHHAVTHLADQLRMALGEVKPSVPHGPFRFAITRYLAIHLLPWPKGIAKGPPEAFSTNPTTFADDLSLLNALIKRVSTCSEQARWPHHAKFGQLTGHDWAVLSYRHLNHHLSQFGV
jgi:hypothetical protein